jgi:DNA-binding winged helix-turn-helix (wHTH) protein
VSVTALHSRAPRAPRNPLRTTPGPRSPRRTRRLEPDAAVSLTFEVTLTSDRRHRDALELIDGLHQLAEELGAAVTVIATPADVPAPPGPLPVPGPGAVVIHADSRAVRRGLEPIAFTKVEYDLLLFLAQHPRHVFTRGQLLRTVWGHHHAGERTVDVHIRRLRAKLGDALVTTVRGVGYRLADDADLHVIAAQGQSDPA